MSATDELRRLLDERGVEWLGTNFTKPTNGHPTNTSLYPENHDAVFIEYTDGSVLRQFDLTPEQAIAATLGNDGAERSNDGVAELQAENDKLRELVRYMHRCYVWGHDWGPYGAPEKEWVEEQMRELGIEVDE